MVTRLGVVSYQRGYYYDRQERRGEYPLDAELGVEGSMSPELERMTVKVCARLPYETSVVVIRELAQIEVGGATAWRKTQAAGERAMVLEAKYMEKAHKTSVADPAQTPPADLAVTLDGAMVHVRQEGWKEFKIGCVFQVTVQPQTKTNRLGEVLDSVRASDPAFVMHLGGPDAFGLKLATRAEQRGWSVAPQRAVIGDGAAWIWNLAQHHFDDAAHIVDWYHAKQHLWSAAHILFSNDAAPAAEWVARQADLLYAGQANSIADQLMRLAALAHPADKAKLETQAGYFSSHHSRMQYRDFQMASLPIGSGTVESAAKQTKQRVAAAGMRWSRPGLERLLPLRAALMEDRFDQLWHDSCPS